MKISGEMVGLYIVFSVLIVTVNIILFFKIWGMTNNVSEIKELLKEWLEIEHPLIEDEAARGIKKK